MKVLESHGRAPVRLRLWLVVPAGVLAGVVLIATVVLLSRGGGTPKHSPGGGARGVAHLSLVSSSPASGAVDIASDTAIRLTFSAPVSLGQAKPVLVPAVAGTWAKSGTKSLVYRLEAPLMPSTTETVTIPGGAHGLRAVDGRTLSAATSLTFTIAPGDPTRLQQLLAQLDFLPLAFNPSGAPPAPKDLARDEPGSFAWKWPGLPAELTSQWTQGSVDMITKAAVESFENQNGLTVDGDAGPAVWAALLSAARAHKVDAVPYVYVLVTKVLPEHLTLYDNGVAQYSGILVNTGATGADTVNGTFAVFEHVRYSDMKGTNPDGSKYNDPNVPYASYFNGGDALHGFIRASYGSPQSNGCVEMTYTNAALVWPLTPIGTLVTVEGPASPPLPTTTTTTAPATTTTAPPTTTTAPPTSTTPPT